MVVARIVVRRRNRVFNKSPQFMRHISGVMQKPVKNHYVREFKKRVADWNHRPQIEHDLQMTVGAITLTVFPGGEHVNLWLWTSRGTDAHQIVARNAPRLAFRLDYRARTQPPDRFGVGDGTATGDLVFAQEVSHPGTAARQSEEGIVEKEGSFFIETITTATQDFYK